MTSCPLDLAQHAGAVAMETMPIFFAVEVFQTSEPGKQEFPQQHQTEVSPILPNQRIVTQDTELGEQSGLLEIIGFRHQHLFRHTGVPNPLITENRFNVYDALVQPGPHRKIPIAHSGFARITA